MKTETVIAQELHQADRKVQYLHTLLSAGLPLEVRKQILSEEYGIRMERELEKEVEEMCNLSEAIEEEGIRKGKKAGERRMSRLVLALLQNGKQDLLAEVADNTELRERMYREYHINA